MRVPPTPDEPQRAVDWLARGWAGLVTDDAPARLAFAQAHRLAEADDDQPTCALAAAGMVLAFAIEFADFRGLGLWSARFVLHAAPGLDAVLGAIDRLRLDAARITLPSLDGGFAFDAATDAAAARLHEGLRTLGSEIAPDERMLLLKMLLDYRGIQLDQPRCEALLAVGHEQVRRGGVGPVWQCRWWLLVMQYQEWFGQAAAAAQAQAEAQALATRHTLPTFRFELACVEMSAALKADDLVAADKLYRELDALRSRVRAGRLPQGLRAQALYLARRGDLAAALERTQLLLALCAEVEVPRRDQGAYEVLRAHCLAGLGRHEEALAVLESLRPDQQGAQGELLEAIVLTVQALRALEQGEADARERVAQAMHRCAALRYPRFLLPLPTQAARLIEVALDDGIEPDFLAGVVRDRRLMPADPTREAWPWRLQIHALGVLQLQRDGLPLASLSAKAQRKPLELLRLLAAHGGGPLPVEAVIDQLWPSLEADAPKASFEMAVSRLRKLLELPEAVRVADDRVLLDPALVWVDVAAFEALARRGTAEAAERALALYRAPLLGNEPLTGLMHTARERLLRLHRATVQAQGERLQAAGDEAAAQRLYEAALAQDPLDEPLHRALIGSQLRQGEMAAAMRSYQRLCELLRQALGVAPSPQTEALLRGIAPRADSGPTQRP